MSRGNPEPWLRKGRGYFVTLGGVQHNLRTADKAEAYRVDYNEDRPHQGLGRRTPAEVRADYERGFAASAESASNEGIVSGALFNAGGRSQSDAQ